MSKKYGGVDNKKEYSEIQEALVVGAPKFQKTTKKVSLASVVFGWLVFAFITYLIVLLFLVAIGVFENPHIPTWVKLLLPLLPTILRIAFAIAKYRRANK